MPVLNQNAKNLCCNLFRVKEKSIVYLDYIVLAIVYGQFFSRLSLLFSFFLSNILFLRAGGGGGRIFLDI